MQNMCVSYPRSYNQQMATCLGPCLHLSSNLKFDLDRLARGHILSVTYPWIDPPWPPASCHKYYLTEILCRVCIAGLVTINVPVYWEFFSLPGHLTHSD